MSNYHDDFSCCPVCPLISHHYPHAGGVFCKGPGCMFYRGGDCLIAAALEKYIITNSPIMSYEEDNSTIRNFLYEED